MKIGPFFDTSKEKRKKKKVDPPCSLRILVIFLSLVFGAKVSLIFHGHSDHDSSCSNDHFSDVPIIVPWFSHDFPNFPMIFPWFSLRFSQFSHDFPLIFPIFRVRASVASKSVRDISSFRTSSGAKRHLQLHNMWNWSLPKTFWGFWMILAM